ncbi:FUSC family protein [Chryseobacterium sp.]|uniref:FUSC family protein n=1 Tax=Chryseobacterium sp. TaxID=1871047 RepID=UPI0025BE0E29|nr:FUSC family protein [Chryseobacterium sp.]
MKVKNPTRHHFQYLIEMKETERKWHFPVLAALCIGSCLLIGWLLGKPHYGSQASVGALTILYFTLAPIAQRMIHLAVCAFGMVFSFSVCLFFSFNIYFAILSFGFVSFLAHFVTSYFKIPPPGNFFFIMSASMATNFHFDLEMIPTRVGLVAMGASLSCTLAFLYSLFIAKTAITSPPRRSFNKEQYARGVESTIIGFFMMLTLVIGHLLKFQNTYWISIAAVGVIQGRNFEHVRQRNTHRILGTFIGVGLTWIILLFLSQAIELILIITILQFIIEMLIVRNYGFAVVFITPLTILLAEAGSEVPHDITALMEARLLDTVIGSLIGLATGFFLYHQKIINNVEKNIRYSYFRIRKLKK